MPTVAIYPNGGEVMSAQPRAIFQEGSSSTHQSTFQLEVLGTR